MKKISNSVKYAPPEGYYDRTKKRRSKLLKSAFNYISADAQQALDIGCGAGADSEQMAAKGLKVYALDGNIEAKKYIDELPNRQNIKFIHCDFEDFNYINGMFDLINASHSLPFTHKNMFNIVFERVKASLAPRGIFVGRLYGVNDEWNRSSETMTFVDSVRLAKLLKGLEIITLEERDEEGTIANGKPKHWHVFDILARKSPRHN